MKIVVKHVDILRGELKEDTEVNEYLVYLYDENDSAIECHIIYGELNLDFIVNTIRWDYKTMDLLKGYDGETELPIEMVSYDEFKELNEE